MLASEITMVHLSKLRHRRWYFTLIKLQAVFGFYQFFHQRPFSVPGSRPDYRIAFICHVLLGSSGLWQFLIFPCFPRSWQFWALSSIFWDDPPLWFAGCFPCDQTEVMGSGKEDRRRWSALLIISPQRVGAVSLSYHWWCHLPSPC